ncbi:replication protein A 70 kDa DNA-binding subunit B-like [Coffea arabica]|uniref:Replication protein A 70 kDa DNA-binding subunit B-like n=1 Tax=Coffea arabica TaxID=13443 RepID=A0ABM4USD7_COFAR
MGPLLQVYKKYLISNAVVRPIPPNFQSKGLQTQWVISTRTLVEEISDDEDVVPVKLTYTKFIDLIKYMNIKDQSVDILAVIIFALDRKQISRDGKESVIQKFVLVNEGFQTVKLSMWDAFVNDEGQKILQNMHKFPIVICRRVRVGYYNGMASSTWFDSVFLVDPPIQEARELKNWALRNESLLLDIVNQKLYENHDLELSFQPSQKFTQDCNLTGMQKAAWVNVRFSFENTFQRYWYMACSECFRSTSAMHGVAFLCNSCKEKHSAQPRCHFDVDLEDETGTVTTSIFGDLAEKLLIFTVTEAMDHFN